MATRTRPRGTRRLCRTPTIVNLHGRFGAAGVGSRTVMRLLARVGHLTHLTFMFTSKIILGAMRGRRCDRSPESCPRLLRGAPRVSSAFPPIRLALCAFVGAHRPRQPKAAVTAGAALADAARASMGVTRLQADPSGPCALAKGPLRSAKPGAESMKLITN